MKNMVNFPIEKEHGVEDGTIVLLAGLDKGNTWLENMARLEYDDILAGDDHFADPVSATKYNFTHTTELLSRPYRFVICLGSDKHNWYWEDWICRKQDLTKDGLKLYELMQEINPDCELHIITFSST